MFHKVSLSLIGIVCHFLLKSSIVLFDVKFNNHIFDAHLLSLMLEVVFEVFPNRRESYHLKSFTQHHSLNMNLMENYLKFLDLIDHGLGIYHFIIEESAHNKLLGPDILGFIFLV